MKNYFLFIPKHGRYLTLMWEFLAKRKFQIHGGEFRKPDLLDQAEVLVLQVTIYFPIDELIDYLVMNVSSKELTKYGNPGYRDRPKYVPRPYRRKKKDAAENSSLTLTEN